MQQQNLVSATIWNGGGNGNPLQHSCPENSMEEPGGLQSVGSQRAGRDWGNLARRHPLKGNQEYVLLCSSFYRIPSEQQKK